MALMLIVSQKLHGYPAMFEIDRATTTPTFEYNSKSHYRMGQGRQGFIVPGSMDPKIHFFELQCKHRSHMYIISRTHDGIYYSITKFQ